jgi:hypothetical protein
MTEEIEICLEKIQVQTLNHKNWKHGIRTFLRTNILKSPKLPTSAKKRKKTKTKISFCCVMYLNHGVQA